MWVWSGFVLSLGLAALASWRSRARAQTYYEGEVYGMDSVAHRKYALVFAAAAAGFLLELAWPPPPGTLWAWVPTGLATMVVLLGILYLATFVRGASGEDE
jgi:hypothetical protein